MVERYREIRQEFSKLSLHVHASLRETEKYVREAVNVSFSHAWETKVVDINEWPIFENLRNIAKHQPDFGTIPENEAMKFLVLQVSGRRIDNPIEAFQFYHFGGIRAEEVYKVLYLDNCKCPKFIGWRRLGGYAAYEDGMGEAGFMAPGENGTQLHDLVTQSCQYHYGNGPVLVTDYPLAWNNYEAYYEAGTHLMLDWGLSEKSLADYQIRHTNGQELTEEELLQDLAGRWHVYGVGCLDPREYLLLLRDGNIHSVWTRTDNLSHLLVYNPA